MDAHRKFVDARIKAKGLDFKKVSNDLGMNDSYIHQYVAYGKPKKLPEDVRRKLAEILDVDEASLGGPIGTGARRHREADLVADAFRIPERDIKAAGGPAGGFDPTVWNEPNLGGSQSGLRPGGAWSFPPAYARQELFLTPGMADILTVEGPSMDDGSMEGLRSGDKVVVDRGHTDARQGAIFAVWDGGGVIIKQVEIVRGTDPVRIICKSLNPKYDPIHLVLDGDAHIIGRVAARISRM